MDVFAFVFNIQAERRPERVVTGGVNREVAQKIVSKGLAIKHSLPSS